MQQKRYLSQFYTANQCGYMDGGSAFQWEPDKPLTCLKGNLAGALGGRTRQECVEESVGGYPVKMWLDKNNGVSASAWGCLKQFIEENESIFGNLFHLQAVEAAAANLTLTTNSTVLFRKLIDGQMSEGLGANSNLEWHKQIFVQYVKTVLLPDFVKNNASLKKATDQLIAILRDELSSMTTTAKCVNDLLPPIAVNATPIDNQIWKEWGIHLKESTMSDSPLSLLKSFPGSLRGVLPPPPTAVYGRNAVLGEVINVPNEACFPGCTPFWWVIGDKNNALKPFSDAKSKLGLTASISPHALREKILTEMCSTNGDNCPFPKYDLVIDVYQAYCEAFFHLAIEILPRIAPFLDSLLADDIAIRIGCKKIQDFIPQFYALLGLNSSKVKILGNEQVFAKEVIIPTEGFSHAPLNNYRNLRSVRSHVEQRLGPIYFSGQKKTVLVIVRDASRRADNDTYSEKFLADLDAALPDHTVKAYRSSDTSMMGCLECQVKEFMAADVIIGSHGASLSHLMFAKARGTVLERILQPLDSGIYAQLAFMMGSNA